MTMIAFIDLALGARFRYVGPTRQVWVKIGPDTVAQWDADKIADRWVGQPICSFSDQDEDPSIEIAEEPPLGLCLEIVEEWAGGRAHAALDERDFPSAKIYTDLAQAATMGKSVAP